MFNLAKIPLSHWCGVCSVAGVSSDFSVVVVYHSVAGDFSIAGVYSVTGVYSVYAYVLIKSFTKTTEFLVQFC